ncbi:MAG: ABC-F family ATP-binding cassette domain-containing protein [Jatrophihabitans sp.]|uniref:ABC-F family ATP-binding cassette domain-containing protein n=1 Tax=Jatrophihabitans sp. TaxID=1932789 RepID=UPI0039162804
MSASAPFSGDLLPAPSSVVASELSFAWPDGTPVLDRLDVSFGTGRTGLVGRNGGGKSTLLRLIAGDLTPLGGSLAISGDVAYLPQHLPLLTGRTVADLLGISARRTALRAIVAGDADPAQFTALDDDWEVEARTLETLDRLGVLRGVDDVLDRPVGTLSGGEAVLTGVAGLLLRRAAISLMDEPTNNLDRPARELLYIAVDSWPGVLIVVSHDRELLERVDEIVELRDGHARLFGGPYSTYAEILSAEQETAQRQVRAAEGEVAREKRQYVETQVKLARRLRTARKAELEKRVPKIVANGLKRKAQVSAGKYRAVQSGRLGDARDALSVAEQSLRDDDRIRVDLPATAVPAGRTVLRVGELIVRGPERIAVVGPKGSGKTTLLEAIVGRRDHPHGAVDQPSVPSAYLPQRLDVLDDARTVLDNVRAAAPSATPNEVRAQLARFLVRGNRVDQLAGTLSGGERFRVSLACLLLAEPAPRLLLLDEPTNNLDLDSLEQLTDALAGYRGALIVASHDLVFLEDIGVSRYWAVEEISLPKEVVVPA